MPKVTDNANSLPHPGHADPFPETRWSLILHARNMPGAHGRRALDEICRTYWYPLYGYARRRGYSPEDAEDLTQDFFRQFFSNGSLDTVSPDRGKLRAFLLVSMKHLLINDQRRLNRKKRGSGIPPISIDLAAAERRFSFEPVDNRSPDSLFDRSWAYTVLDTVLNHLQEYYAHLGKGDLFAAIRGYLGWNDGGRPYAEVALELGTSPESIRFAVHQMRKRFRSLLEREITETVDSASDAREEIDYLCKVLAS